MGKVIEIKNLKKYYKNVKAVDDVSIEVEKGDIVAILGPNGAGKTTTVETLEGLREATSGDIYYFGKKVKKIDHEIKEQIGVQLQNNSFFENLTVKEIIKAFAGLYKKSVPVSSLLERFKLEEKKNSKIKNLSGGQLQRVALAVSVVNDPEIVFLDEPTTGLDPQARRNLWEEIEKLKNEGKTIILTTHYMEEAEICNKIAVIDGGKIVAHDTPYALKKKFTKDKAYISTSNEYELEQLLEKYQLEYVKKKGYYKVDAENTNHLLQVLSLQKEAITDIEIKKGTFNDVFIEITGKTIREDA